MAEYIGLYKATPDRKLGLRRPAATPSGLELNIVDIIQIDLLK